MAEKNSKPKLTKTKTPLQKKVTTKPIKTKTVLKAEKKVVIASKKNKEAITKNVKKVLAKKPVQKIEKIVTKEVKTKKKENSFELINIIAIISIILVIAVIGVLVDKNNQSKASNTKKVEAAQSINYDCIDGKSALDILKEKAEVKTVDSTYGVYVDQINGTANNDGSFWIFYVNGQMADVDPAQYQCKPDDKIEWRYEKIM